MRFDSPNKKPLSNFAAEAASLKGAVLLWIIGLVSPEAKVCSFVRLLNKATL